MLCTVTHNKVADVSEEELHVPFRMHIVNVMLLKISYLLYSVYCFTISVFFIYIYIYRHRPFTYLDGNLSLV